MEGGFTFSPDTIDLNAPYGGGTMANGDPVGGFNAPVRPTPPSAPFTGGWAPQQPAANPAYDLSQTGAAENQWTNVGQPFFSQPTNSQNAYGTYSPIFQNMATQGGPTYSADAYNMFNAPTNAGLDAYYDNAWNDTSDRLNTALAARGEGNSSFATDELRRASVGLGAEQANREADYALRRSQVGGDLASRASGESLAGRESQLSAARSGSALAGDVDSANLQNVLGGMGGASIGQNAREGRVGDMFDRTNVVAMEQINTLLPTMQANIEKYTGLRDKPFELQAAIAQAELAGDQAQVNNLLSLAGVATNAVGVANKI